MDDITKVSDEMNQLLAFQADAIESTGCDVNLLASRMANMQRRHLQESLHEMSVPAVNNHSYLRQAEANRPILRELRLEDILSPDMLWRMNNSNSLDNSSSRPLE